MTDGRQQMTQAVCQERERILARKVARELTAEEIAKVSGGKQQMRPADSFSGACLFRDDCVAY
jgi:hypothetical protein